MLVYSPTQTHRCGRQSVAAGNLTTHPRRETTAHQHFNENSITRTNDRVLTTQTRTDPNVCARKRCECDYSRTGGVDAVNYAQPIGGIFFSLLVCNSFETQDVFALSDFVLLIIDNGIMRVYYAQLYVGALCGWTFVSGQS